MKIIAGQTPQTISLVDESALAYKEGRPSVRRYDSCFYEISAATDDEALYTDE